MNIALSRNLRALATALGYIAFVAWVLFATIVIVLRYVVLPHVDHYRPDLERIASQAAGETVRIGAIDASWHGLRPAVGLRDVEMIGADGATLLVLRSVDATLSWQTLLAGQLRLAALNVDVASLTVRRDAEGQLSVGGYTIRKKASPDNRPLTWLLAQDGVHLRAAQLVWHDELADANGVSARPDLVLADIALALERSGGRHRAALHASPPSALAAPIDVRAAIDHSLFGDVADVDDWSGELYADLASGDLVAWRTWFPLPSTIDAGHGRVRAWLAFSRMDDRAGFFARRMAERIGKPIPPELDRIAGVTADLALDDMAARWGAMADAPEYAAIGSIDGRVVASQTRTEQHFAALHMAVQPRVGAKVPPTDFEVHRTIGSTLDDESGTASLGAIDIATTLGLVPLPLVPPAIAEKVAALKPRGALESVVVKWTGWIAAPRTFEAEARFSRIAVAPQAPTPEAIAAAAREIVGENGLVRKGRPAFGQPGAENLAGTVTATRTRDGDALPVTRATLSMHGDDVTLNAPGLFDEPTLRFAHLAADVNVRVEGPDLEVKVDHASLDNPDLAGTVDLTFRHGPKSGGLGDGGGRGWLDLDAKLSRADVARVPRYLPNIIGERARVYLRRSLIAGVVDEASFRMRGPVERLNLREMPGALAVANPVTVPNALVAIREGTPATRTRSTSPATTPATTPAASSTATRVGSVATGTDVAKPPEPDDAIFHALIKVHGATFRYGPGRQPDDPLPASGIAPSPTSFIPWPAFEDLDADIVFDRARLTVHARSARVYDYKLTDVTAELPALADPNHVLRVVGRGTGPMQDLVHFINESPISRWLRGFTGATRATGNAALFLALDLPLTRPRYAEVAGSLQFAHNDLALNAIVPPLLGIDGRMDFSDRGLAIDGLTATAFGGPVRVDAATHGDGYIELIANGTIDVAALKKSTDDSRADGIASPVSNAVDRAAVVLSGTTDYRLALRVRSKRVTDLADNGAEPAPVVPAAPGQPDLVVESDLKGLAIALPTPFAKSADTTMPLRIELARTVSTDATTPDSENIHATLGDLVGIDIARQRTPDGQIAITHAGYRVGSGPSARDGPSAISIDVPSIDVDAWRDAIRRVSAAPRASAVPPADRPPPNEAYDALLPSRASLKTGVVLVAGRSITNVSATAERTPAGWQADIAADQVAGRIAYTDVSGRAETRTGVAPTSSGKFVARLSRLSIPQAEPGATRVESTIDPGKSTEPGRARDFPAIDVVVDQFDLRGRTLGRLELLAENVKVDDRHEWQLQKLGLTTPEARFVASGVWGRGADAEHTRLDVDLQASDVGALMDRFGLNRTISSGTAKLTGNVAWNGGPSTIDFASMSGSLALAADKGRFLKAEPGVAKLLNILSLQGLARRLTFDFSDVFAPGFAFDTVRADATIDHGIATTNDFTMRGVQAIVTMAGHADLEHETTDLHVRVEPQLNAGAAALAVAVANPIAGAAAFVAQYLFKDKISQALAFEYNVSGPWSKPDVVKIDRNGKMTPVVPKSAAAATEPAP